MDWIVIVAFIQANKESYQFCNMILTAVNFHLQMGSVKASFLIAHTSVDLTCCFFFSHPDFFCKTFY